MKPGSFFLIAVLLGLATYLFVILGEQLLWFGRPSFTFEIIMINVIVTSGIYWWLSDSKPAQLFTSSYLLSIVMKLIFFSTLLLLIRIVFPESLRPNVILLLICYVVFTGHEVISLFRKVNQ